VLNTAPHKLCPAGGQKPKESRSAGWVRLRHTADPELLAAVKSPPEFFSLSNNLLRQQFETLSRQAQELGAIVQRMTTTTAESVKAGIHKAV